MKERLFHEEVLYFNQKLGEVIEQKLLECNHEILRDALTYIQETGGKRLRPIICLLSAEAVGGSREKALSTAIAIELLHNASLVHDDIIDENDIRRKNPSNPARYGEKKAIIIGDLLFGLSCEMLARCGVPEVVSLVSNAVADIAMGEYLEFTLRTLQEANLHSYMEVAELKTAATFMASAEAGAVLGGGNEVEIENLRTYGKNLGVAFQIQDDILDICGDPANTGKPVGLDIKNGEQTLLVIHALHHSNESEKEYIKAILSRERDPGIFDINRVRSILVDAGSIEYALQLAEEFVRTARNCIAGLEDSEAKQKLQFIAQFSMERIKIHVSNTFI
ncbi:MAG: polyprenyl synthetase family protein [Methanophagales archaeon ANME-1-THS]|nr:MAG: polyprenyl synthetase family protein [Methanophagales archaeon ANME-1-THS]